MFSTKTFVALLVIATPFLARADVVPTVPAPGAVYNEGSNCSVAWNGDSSSTTLWKDMAIELMTGSNTDMVFITTIATGLDGTVSGQYSYPCPEVTPNSIIYFVQFTSPGSINLTWTGTGRFAIASSTGATTTATNSTTENGVVIPWGTGRLVDPSNAVAEPSFAASNSSSNSTTLAVVTSSTAGSNTDSPTAVITPVWGASPSSATATATTTTQSSSGAMTTFDIRVLGAAAAATLALSLIW